MNYRDLINLDRYPIDCPGPELDDCLNDVRAAMAEDGCAVLKGFLTARAIEALTFETDGVSANAHRSFRCW